MKQVTPLVRDQLAADYRAGLGICELARKHSLHRYTVSQHLAAAGVVMRRTITESEKNSARELYLAGATYAEIARQLKRDPTTVKKMVRTGPSELSFPFKTRPSPQTAVHPKRAS